MASFSILSGLDGTVSLPTAVDLITALIAVLPDAVIGIIPEVTRHFKKFKLNTRVLGTSIEADARTDIGTSLRNPVDETSETIFPAGPLGDREISGL